MFKLIKERLMKLESKKLLRLILAVVLGGALFGYVVRQLIHGLLTMLRGNGFRIQPLLLLRPGTWLIGYLTLFVLWVIVWGWPMLFGGRLPGKGLLGGRGKDNVVRDSALENSRFLTDQERDKYFPPTTYEQLQQVKKDGIPVRALIDKKGKLEINFLSGAHSLVIGSTGSGKTTTFINPMIQLIGATNCGSSMIMTDPKGELFSLHSKFLKNRGYDVLLLDLRDTYSSSRWNPLESIWDMYQDYVHTGDGIRAHRDDMAGYPDLKQPDGPADPGVLWIEWNGNAYADPTHCQDDISVSKQKIYDEMFEDLNDLISVMCPVENEKDPLWEKGARSLIMAICLAMLEDSEDTRLGMTKDKFNFFNINKALSNSDDDFKALKEYFEGRSPLSQAASLSRQVLAAAEQTTASYMSIAFDKMNMFNDRGLCGLTSATDIDAARFADRPTALFLKIPDEKDTRHGLAAVFVLCMY